MAAACLWVLGCMLIATSVSAGSVQSTKDAVPLVRRAVLGSQMWKMPELGLGMGNCPVWMCASFKQDSNPVTAESPPYVFVAASSKHVRVNQLVNIYFALDVPPYPIPISKPSCRSGHLNPLSWITKSSDL
jgi:hypothetical protein